jgi:hypothetical protein
MKKIFIAFFILSFFLVSAPVQAQNPEPLNCDENICFTPQITIPGTDIKAGQTIKIGGDTIGKYLLALYTFGIYAAGIVATIVIMAGGFVWLMAGGNTSQVEQARTMIKGAITGYVLLLLSWVLLNTINPNLTRFESLYIEPVANQTLLIQCKEPKLLDTTQLVAEKEKGETEGFSVNQAPTFESCNVSNEVEIEQLFAQGKKCYCRQDRDASISDGGAAEAVKCCALMSTNQCGSTGGAMQCARIEAVSSGSNCPTGSIEEWDTNPGESCQEAIKRYPDKGLPTLCTC